jgi:DMSO/TMAO reductase YedYZ molybdopterin-dependent catalytic subunit
VAAGAALGAGELVTGVDGSGTSLVTAVGDDFIERFAGSLKELAVELFGTNDKAALVVGIVVTTLALGAAAGLAAGRRPWVAPAVFAAFGVVGAAAYASAPLASDAIGVVAGVAAVGTGLLTLAVLHRLAPGAPDSAPQRPSMGGAGRRAFLVAAGSVAAGAAATAAVGRRLGVRDPGAEVRATTVLPEPAGAVALPASEVQVPGISPYVTPTGDFYRIDTALVVPRVDPGSWRLSVDGLVDRPLSIGFDELLAMESVSEPVTLQCVSNEVGGDLVGNAVWQGVPLASLLDRVGVRPEGRQVVGRSVDGWTAGFPTELVGDGRTALVAYAMNGELLPARHGFPARLVVSGLYGYVSATKWLEAIELTTLDVDGYWVPRGWSKDGPIKTASRIDVPRGGARVPPGPTAVAGVAWAPGTGIDAVEVQVDDGPWLPCTLGDVASEHTWVQWHVRWDAEPGDHVLRVRATDASGAVQTAEVTDPPPDGATGHHTRRVRVG